MNKVIIIGRSTDDPKITYTQDSTCIARFNIAVDRKYKKDGEASADFINCVAFSKTAEFIEKYILKGTKVAIVGRIQTGSYTNRDNKKVYTTDIVVEEIEFAESKKAAEPKEDSSIGEGFATLPDSLDSELPFT